jgi:hypothetical protein
MTVSKRFLEKLEVARDALSHSHPSGDAEAILEAGLDLLIEKAAKRKGIVARPSTRPCTRPQAKRAAPPIESVRSNESFPLNESASPNHPAPSHTPVSPSAAAPRDEEPSPSGRPPVPRPRHIPADVRREVWLRDGGRCQFRLENGEFCGSTHRLQFDHIRPFALGGDSTAGNIRLACAAHNLLAARRAFGDALMDRYVPVRPSSPSAAPPR